MRKTRITKLLSLALALSLIFGLLSFTASASLTDTATAFSDAVADIKNADSLEAREIKLAEATEALGAYITAGGTEADAEIADAYADYLEEKTDIETKVGYCLDFIDYVSAATDVNNTYPVKRENLDKAEALIDIIDKDYKTVASYVAHYNNTVAELYEPVLICEAFIKYAKLAAEATTYEEASSNLKTAEAAKQQISIPDYPGIDEAEANLDIARATMSMAVLKATPFIQAVRNINKAESVPIGVQAAYAALEGVDETAEGVPTALNNLKKAERNYNKSAEDGNEAMNELATLAFGLIFG
ncbi:MAG: hypothetical protein IJD79_05670 [Clostridia bacterium]|nr:hypothetical protein [Clostridia bacterium]